MKNQVAVKLQDVCMVFKQKGGKEFNALKSLSFSIPRGSIFCLLGPNGSGKTTTINLINGLLSPTKGEIRILGLDPHKNRRELLKKIALVPQETALYHDLSPIENLRFHGEFYGVTGKLLIQRIDELLELVGLTDRRNDRVGSFSGGMQRRLALARALLTSPQLLLLDEPTLGVDVQSRNAIWEHIRLIASSGNSVLLTTNYMEEAEVLGNNVLIIDKGQPIIQGSPIELKSALREKELVLQFPNQQQAQMALNQLQDKYQVICEESQLYLTLTETKQAMNIIQILSNELGSDFESMKGLSLKEPNLQDVFLHYTGRQLRN